MVNIVKNFLIMHQQSATNAFETASKRGTQKTAEATDDLIGNKIADIITKVKKTIKQNNSERNENYREIPKEKCVSPEDRKYCC